jgi:antitoxin HicB
MLSYQIEIVKDRVGYLINIRDLPHVPAGCPDEYDPYVAAVDAILTEFLICQDERRAFPLPKAIKAGANCVTLPMMASLKVFLHNAMIERDFKKADLARATGWADAQVARVLDVRYQSKLPLIEQALHVLGKSVSGKLVNWTH